MKIIRNMKSFLGVQKLTLALFICTISLSLISAAIAQEQDEGGGRGGRGRGGRQDSGGRGGFGGGGPGGGGFGGFGGFGGPGGTTGPDKLTIISNKGVQTELEVTEKQLKLIEDRQKKQREMFSELRGMDPEEAKDEVTKFNKTNDAVITKALTAKQNKRLSEISIQQRGTRALTDPEVAKALVLTGKQKEQLEDIQNEARDAMREQFTAMAQSGGFGGRGFGPPGFGGPGGGAPGGGVPGGGAPNGAVPGQPPAANGEAPKAPAAPPADGQPAAEGDRPAGDQGRRGGRGGRPQMTDEQRKAMEQSMEKMNDLRTGTEEKLLAVLTDKQQAKWKELQGEPFKMEWGGRGRGRGPTDGKDGESASTEGKSSKSSDKPADKPAAKATKAPSKTAAPARDKLPNRK
jgi:Spy/CpxP family protein refolding chaperone